MSFYETYKQYRPVNFGDITDNLARKSIYSEKLNAKDFAALLSPQAENYLEEMAQRAHSLTVQYFGKTVQLYTPMYLSSWCDNQCTYCGFNSSNQIERKKLSLEEVEKEAEFIDACMMTRNGDLSDRKTMFKMGRHPPLASETESPHSERWLRFPSRG